MILRRPQQRLKAMGIRHSRSSSVFETIPIGCGWRVVGRETVSLERVCGVLEHLFLFLYFGVTFFAPVCDTDKNLSGIGQGIFDHFVDNGCLYFDLSVAVWQVGRIVDRLNCLGLALVCLVQRAQYKNNWGESMLFSFSFWNQNLPQKLYILSFLKHTKKIQACNYKNQQAGWWAIP